MAEQESFESSQGSADIITLESLAKLTGFTTDLIKKELLLSGDDVREISLVELRNAMLSFIDRSMVEEESA